MPVTRAQAKEICTKPEYEMVESSFRPAITSLTPARLRSKVERSRKLQDKYRELAQKQNRESKEQQGHARGTANQRTEQKARLFAETRERFEKRLAETESKDSGEAGGQDAGKVGRARGARAAAENRKARRQTKRELGSAGSQ
jgi:hypothetical protein